MSTVIANDSLLSSHPNKRCEGSLKEQQFAWCRNEWEEGGGGRGEGASYEMQAKAKSMMEGVMR
jgi:hypothetical protein